jgi:hypothetical protein
MNTDSEYDAELERFVCCEGRVCVCPSVDCANGDCVRTAEHEVGEDCDPPLKLALTYHGPKYHGSWCQGCQDRDWDAVADARADR